MERPALLAELERRAEAFDPERRWVRPGGATLADRVWRGGQEVRAQIDAVLREAIRTQEDALVTATKLEQYLDPAYAPRRNAAGKLERGQRKGIVTAAPGRAGMGSFPARRLARTEVSRAHARATEDSAALDPFVDGLRWSLSGRHPKGDPCDDHARRDVGLGPGVYPLDDRPRMPEHPMCLCHWEKAVTEDVDAVVTALRQQYGLDMPRTAEEEALRQEVAARLEAAVVDDVAEEAAEAVAAAPRRLDIDNFTFAYEDEKRLLADLGTQFDAWRAAAPPDEVEAMRHYKGGGYGTINRYARGLRDDGQLYINGRYVDVGDAVGLIDRAITNSELPADARLLRGMRFARDETPEAFANIKAGDVITDAGYVSATTDYEIAANFAGLQGSGRGSFLLEIYAPKGTKAMAIDPLTNAPAEFEVVLPRGTSFLVRSVEPLEETLDGRPSDATLVTLEVIA